MADSAPLDDVRQISKLAYGFMAAKALFAALDLDVFSRLADGPKDLDKLAAEVGITPPRLLTLLTACTSLGLLVKLGDRYVNAPASQDYLVRSAPRYFGDYYRFQIDRQVYPAFERLGDALRGERATFYSLTQTETEADYFSRAQHSGSLGPAAVVAKLVDLSGCRQLLDVAGGSGAFSMTFCRRYPELRATILDFPAVRPVADRFLREAKLEHRIAYVAGNALDTPWPDGQDVVLISYLLSAVSTGALQALLSRAFDALVPGGQLLLHDFMVDDDRTGPTTAALWLLCGLLNDPDAALLTPGVLSELVVTAGFGAIQVHEVIPTITRLVTATKPRARM